MKIKVAVAKSVKALVGHMAKAPCGSASHWAAYQPKEHKFKKEKKYIVYNDLQHSRSFVILIY